MSNIRDSGLIAAQQSLSFPTCWPSQASNPYSSPLRGLQWRHPEVDGTIRAKPVTLEQIWFACQVVKGG